MVSQDRKQISATKPSRGTATVARPATQIAEDVSSKTRASIAVPDFRGEGVDPDRGEFAGEVDREDYLRRREEWVNRRRGIKPGVPFDPAARGRAIRKMELQETALRPRKGGFNLQSINGPSSTTTWSSMARPQSRMDKPKT